MRPAVGHPHDPDVGALEQVVVAAAVRADGDRRAVRRPGDALHGDVPAGEPSGAAIHPIDDPQLGPPVEGEARAVQHEREAIDVAIVGAWRCTRLGLGRRTPRPIVVLDRRRERSGEDRQVSSVGRPLEGDDTLGQARQPARLPAEASPSPTVEGQQVCLRPVLTLLRITRAIGLLLDVQPPIREEGERPTIGREARLRLVAPAEGEATRVVRTTVRRAGPDCVAIAILGGCDRLDDESDVRAVGR